MHPRPSRLRHAATIFAQGQGRAASAFVALATMLAGCNEVPAKAPATAAASTPRATIAAPVELTKHQRRLGFLPLTMLLPDAEGWATTRDDAKRYEGTHAPSGTRLVVEELDGTFGTSVQCAQKDRDPALAPETRFDQGVVRAPLAVDVAFELHASQQAGGNVVGMLRAHATASGRCFRLRFETRTRGEDAASETAARLAFFRDVSLPSILLVRDGHTPSPSRTSLERRGSTRYG